MISGSEVICFLRDRNLRVRVEQSLQAPHELQNGVPQGSLLSATLSTVAINRNFEGTETIVGKCLYVDDLALFNLAKPDVMIKGIWKALYTRWLKMLTP